MSEARNIVVIGGGPAGVFAAIGAKKQDRAANVTLLTDEACEPYEKPPLSKAVLLGKAAPMTRRSPARSGLAGHGVNLALNARVDAIDRAGRAVVTADGERLPYDALVHRDRLAWCARSRRCRSACRGYTICAPRRRRAGSRRSCANRSIWW